MVFHFLPIASSVDRFEKKSLFLRFPCTVVHGINSSLIRTHTGLGEGVVDPPPRRSVYDDNDYEQITPVYANPCSGLPKGGRKGGDGIVFNWKTKRGTAAKIVTFKVDEKQHYSINITPLALLH